MSEHPYLQFYLGVLEDSPHMIRCHNAEGEVVFCNQAWLEFTGQDAAHCSGWQWLDAVCEAHRESLKRELLASMKNREACELTYRIANREGSCHTISDRLRPFYDPEGRLVGFIASCFDLQDYIVQEDLLQRLSIALEQIADIVVIADTQGHIEYVNRAFEEVTGYGRQEVIGQNPRLLKSGLHDPAIYADLWRTISGGSVFRAELINRRKDGSLYEEELVISPLCDSRGEVTRYIATGRDVTERKETEESLRLTKAIIDHSIDAIYLVDEEGHILFASEPAARMLGYARSELERMNVTDLAADGTSLDDLLAQAEQVRRGGSMVFESLHKDAQGRTIPVEIASSLMSYHGEEIFCVIARDITWRLEARRQLEELNATLEERVRKELTRRMEKERLLSEVYDAANVGVAVTDAEGNFIHVNTAFCALYKLDRDTLLARSFLDLLPSQKRQSAQEGYAHFIEQQMEQKGLEWTIERADGTVVEVLVSRKSIEVSRGHLLVVSFFVDVSELKALQREHETQEHLLIQQSKMAALGEMVGAIAHQWRQPLNAVGLKVQSIKLDYEYGELDQARLESVVESVMTIVRHMSKTIDDFRNFFKPDRAAAPFDLRDSIHGALDILAAQLEYHNIAVSCDLGSEPLRCQGYPNEFKQVVLNILSNAKDAILEARVEGEIQLRALREGGWALITIANNGGEIPEETMARIYEPYFTTKEPGQGTGIGLYMSKMIIERSFQGRLYSSSEQGWTSFFIELALLES